MSPHIVVFDSGVGGTSVLAHIQKALPNAHYSYIMDNKFLPYGELTKSALNTRIVEVMTQLNIHLGCFDLLVIACNTASTHTLELLRSKLDVPIVGVVPAIKPAAQTSTSKEIGVLATPATISNEYTKRLIGDFANHCDVRLFGSTELVAIAEKYFWQGELCLKQLSRALAEVKLSNIDTLVLGCTHFPIIAPFIKQVINSECTLVDSGAAIARRVKGILGNKLSVDTIKKGPLQYYATAPIEQSKLNIKQIDL